MKYLSSLVLAAALLLTGCSGQASQPRVTQTILLSAAQTITPTPTATVTQTQTATVTPTATPTSAPTPTRTPFVETYPLKQVWIEYGFTPRQLDGPESTLPLSMPAWVLYTDGTLIVYQGEAFLTKTLSKNETCELLNRISRLGFYRLETDGGDYKSSPIYANLPPDQSAPVEALYEYLIVNWHTPKTLWVYDAIKDYAISPVKNILNIFRGYNPYGAQPYVPDRLALYVQQGRATVELGAQEAMRWPAGAPPLREAGQEAGPGVLYVDGFMARSVFRQFQAPYTWRVFTDQGQEYSVMARPVFPHERRTGQGIQTELPAEIEPPFTCR